jgi:hypothetical protein
MVRGVTAQALWLLTVEKARLRSLVLAEESSLP